MYSAMDIARYIINYCIDEGNPISNLKLQKILYYIQAAFLVEKGGPCFEEEIVNWRHGPVQTDVYHNFKGYVGSNITDKQNEYTELEFGGDSIMHMVVKEFKPKEIITEKDRDLIERVVDSYKDVGAWDMVVKTKEETPVINTESHGVITLNSICNYFKASHANKARIYGKYYVTLV